MAKTFYTERDIQDLLDRGVTALEINDDVVLTDVGRELALKHGLRLTRPSAARPADAATAELIHRVKAAVLARLGSEVDAKLLDAVVTRVVQNLK